MALDNSASPISRILTGLFERKPPESCQKDVTKLSKTIKKYCLVDAVRHASLFHMLDCNQSQSVVIQNQSK